MMLRVILVVTLVSAVVSAASSQAARDVYKRDFPTENVTMGMEANKNANRPKRKRYDYLYTESSRGILYGNPCALQATRKMGFEYVVQPAGIPGSPGRKELEKNNFFVKLKLVFTRGPWWKLVLNNRLRKCRQQSGDFVG
ncbi:hypothetical protein C7460_13727 [Marinoscillum furvescens DSM 4134]|uniref:Uncharacterized protein n=2 Tax=Marinoscillum furvescens TaxID=1026 RepID=A0A3D9KVS4_MARFU|nr:hypothetical protein C7460_13727 [Marinoscillum furvescens DSM 4134]